MASILFTIPNFETAGSGRALFEIARRLDRRSFEPSICIASGSGTLAEEVRREGIPLLQAPFTLPAKPYLSLPLRARRLAKAFPRFDIWHSFHYLDDYTEPLVARMSGARAWVYTKKNMSWNRRSWLLRTAQARAVLAQNRDMQERFFASRRLAAKTHAVPRGVDTRRFAPAQADGANTDLKADAERPLVIGCVAHLVPVKGHPTLIDAMARIPNARLQLAGKPLDATYTEKLRHQIRSLGLDERVELLGDVQDVPGFLHSLDIFVLPTWQRWRMEGSPVALLEAMACGLPVIATDIPGSRDIVVDGESGLLVPAEDPTALAQALRRLIDDEGAIRARHALASGARKRIEKRYTIDREVQDHEAIYREILGLNPSSSARQPTGKSPREPRVSRNPSSSS